MNAAQTPARPTECDTAAAISIRNWAPRHPFPEPLSADARELLASLEARDRALYARDAARAARISIWAPQCSARTAKRAETRRSNRAAARRHIAKLLHAREQPKPGDREVSDAELARWIDVASRPPRPPKPNRSLAPEPISRERQAEALRAPRRAPAALARHLRALLCLAIETGARTQELVAAQWSDFDLRNGMWMIPATPKRRARFVPLSDDAMRAMRRLELASLGRARLFHPFESTRSATRALAAALASAGAQPVSFAEMRLQAFHQLVAWHGLSSADACRILGRGLPRSPLERYALHREERLPRPSSEAQT